MPGAARRYGAGEPVSPVMHEPTGPLPRPRSALHWIAFGGGAGLAPRAPGTAGTAVAVPIYVAMAGGPLAMYLVAVALVVAVGIWACGRTARELGVHDHPGIVLDEVAGFLVTMTALPLDWRWIVAGFVVFRILDIAKPWPISLFDRRVRGGFGIMLDDVIAGAFACAALHLAQYLASV